MVMSLVEASSAARTRDMMKVPLLLAMVAGVTAVVATWVYGQIQRMVGTPSPAIEPGQPPYLLPGPLGIESALVVGALVGLVVFAILRLAVLIRGHRDR